jgi:RPA family protein
MNSPNYHLPVFICMLQYVSGGDSKSSSSPSSTSSTSSPVYSDLNGKPMERIRIEGTCVQITQKKSSTRFTIDDGTGIITITLGKFVNKTDLAKLEVGRKFAVIGKYKNATKMSATNLFEIVNTSPIWIAKVLNFWR